MADVIVMSPDLTTEERQQAIDSLGVYKCAVCGSKRMKSISGEPAQDAAGGFICPLCQPKEATDD